MVLGIGCSKTEIGQERNIAGFVPSKRILRFREKVTCRKSKPDTAERGKRIMAIFHYTVKIVGRSKGKSIISASAYLNGDVMKNEETGRIKRTMPVMESGRKPDHKKTKCTAE